MNKCNCVVCDKELDNIQDEGGFQPYGGISFRSYGHYGSCRFDPMDGSWVELVLCDECFGNILWTEKVYRQFYEQCKEEMNEH